jgi:hypothetical protein
VRPHHRPRQDLRLSEPILRETRPPLLLLLLLSLLPPYRGSRFRFKGCVRISFVHRCPPSMKLELET